jgi:hypothetical protein
MFIEGSLDKVFEMLRIDRGVSRSPDKFHLCKENECMASELNRVAKEDNNTGSEH